MAAPFDTLSVSVALKLIATDGVAASQARAEAFLDKVLRRYVAEGYEAVADVVLHSAAIANLPVFLRDPLLADTYDNLCPAPSLTGAVAGDTQVTLSWSAPVNNGGSAITGYMIKVFVLGVEQAELNTTAAANATSKAVTGLTNGTAYTFKVAAVNAIGTGALSAASSATTPAAVPGAPTTVAGTPGDTEVALTWVAPEDNGGSAITDYQIKVYVLDVEQAELATTVGAATAAKTVTGLTNDTAYTFKVAAVNAMGAGALSVASDAVTPVSAG